MVERGTTHAPRRQPPADGAALVDDHHPASRPLEATGGGEARQPGSDDHDVDPVGLLMVCDALPPVTFDLGRPGWAPTLELTVHVRAVPAPGWLKVSHRTRNLAGGMFEEDCEVWDSAGRLVAQSRQLAMQPRA